MAAKVTPKRKPKKPTRNRGASAKATEPAAETGKKLRGDSVECPRCKCLKGRCLRTIQEPPIMARWRKCSGCGLIFKTSESLTKPANFLPIDILSTLLKEAVKSGIAEHFNSVHSTRG